MAENIVNFPSDLVTVLAPSLLGAKFDLRLSLFRSLAQRLKKFAALT